MKKTSLLGVRHLLNGEKEIRVEYYFLKEYRSRGEEAPLCGIKIVKHTTDGTELVKETESAPALSYSEKFVKQLIHVMMKNLVTPIHMLDVIDDIVSKEGVV